MPERTVVGVQQILIDVKDLLLRHPSACGHELTVDALESDVIAEINGTDLLQILLNLTINALQCTDAPHSVRILAEPRHEPLDLSAFRDGPQERFINREGFLNRGPLLAISIADDGPGIAPEVVAKMFDENITTKAPGRGTGLGLSIVRRLLREANAAVHLRTEITRGSTFTLYLQIRQ